MVGIGLPGPGSLKSPSFTSARTKSGSTPTAITSMPMRSRRPKKSPS